MIEEIKKIELEKINAELKNIKSQQEENEKEDDQLKIDKNKTRKLEEKEYSWVQRKITKKSEYKKHIDNLNIRHANEREKTNSINNKRASLNTREKQLEEKKETLNSSISLYDFGIDSLESYYEYCHNNGIYIDIQLIFANYPNESRNNLLFMQEAIKSNFFNIKYDLTNDIELYRIALEQLYIYLKENMPNNITRDINCQQIKDILQMLNNEEMLNSESGLKFIDYIKEAIRAIDREKIYIPDVKEAYEIFNTSFAKELMQLYNNDEIVIGMHGTHYYEENNSILKKGLKTSVQDEEAINNLRRTVAYNLPFLRLLTYSASEYAGANVAGRRYNYIITIPKGVLDENSDVPIWGGNSDDLRQDYILPQYVYGVVDTLTNQEIIKYNGEKENYEYLYTDMSKNPINVKQR